MTLDYQLAVVALGGLDTKSDARAVVPGKLVRLENATYTSPGVLTTRYGYNALSLAIENSGGNLAAAQAIATFNDELLLFSGTSVYSYAPGTARWMDRGRATSAVADSDSVIRNGYTQTNPDLAYIEPTAGAGVYVFAWEDSRGGIRYAVQDATSGTWLVADAAVAGNGTTAIKPKLVTFNGNVVLFYALAGNLYYRRINPLAPASIGAEVNVLSVLSTTRNGYDVLVVGARLFIGWNDAGAVTKLNYLSTAYALGTAVSPMNATGNVVGLWADASQNVWIAGASATTLYVAAYNYALVSALTFHTVETIASVTHVCGYVPANSTTATVYYEVSDQTLPYIRTYVRSNTCSLAGTVGTAADFKRGVGLATKVFVSNAVAYVGLLYDGGWVDDSNNNKTSSQATLFVANSSGDIVARLQPGVSGGLRPYAHATLSEVPAIGRASLYGLVSQEKTEIVVDAGKAYASKGVTRSTLDFASTSRFVTAALGNNLLIVGGLLQAYDGVSVTEHGFNLCPEALNVVTDNSFSITRVTPGSGGAAEVTDVVIPAGNSILGGQYFKIHGVSSPVDYYVWFTVDGVGTDPAVAAYTAIAVAINNYDSAGTVGTAVAAAIGAVSANFSTSVTISTTTTVRITNVSVGAVTTAANASAPLGVSTGSMVAGTYRYCAVYEWHDNFGQIHRSAPGIPISVTVGTPAFVAVRIPTLRLTTKTGMRAAPRIVLYRTIASGLNFYRVSGLTTPLNVTTLDYVYVCDTLTDTVIAGNESAYFNGDVLNNDPPEASSVASTYRNRVFLAGLPAENTVVYSKLTDPDEAVAFSAFFSLSADPFGGAVTALAAIDDKQIIFKETAIFAMAGDGPNNAGSGGYGDPVLVTSDVGCTEPLSLVRVPDGVLFKSAKGIYQLDRSMAVTYVGAPVEGFNDLVITGAALVPTTNQVRFTTAGGTCLVFDYFVGQWSVFTNHPAVGCCIWREQFCYARSDGTVYVESASAQTDAGAAILQAWETGELQFAGPMAYQAIRRLGFLADYRGPHKILLEVAWDKSPVFTQSAVFDAQTVLGSDTFGSDATFGASAVFGGAFQPYLVSMHLGKTRSISVRVRMRQLPGTYAGAGLSCSSLGAEWATMGNIGRMPYLRRV